MKFNLQFSKDGAIQGWAVSLGMTVIMTVLIILAFLNDTICERFVKMAAAIVSVYLGQLGIWLGYKVLKPEKENGEAE